MASSGHDDRPKILVVDGNERNAKLLHRFLAEEGYEHTIVTDLDTFDEQLAEASQFALVVIDIDRFDRQVWKRCERLHDHKVPFIVLSSIRNRGLRRKSREHGAQTYVTKPVSKAEFQPLIEKWVSPNT